MADRNASTIFCRHVLVSVSQFNVCLFVAMANLYRYVAMHTMQENGPDSTSRESQVNGYGDARDGPPKSDRPMRDLIASVVGMILPLFLQIGHAH